MKDFLEGLLVTDDKLDMGKVWCLSNFDYTWFKGFSDTTIKQVALFNSFAAGCAKTHTTVIAFSIPNRNLNTVREQAEKTKMFVESVLTEEVPLEGRFPEYVELSNFCRAVGTFHKLRQPDDLEVIPVIWSSVHTKPDELRGAAFIVMFTYRAQPDVAEGGSFDLSETIADVNGKNETK